MTVHELRTRADFEGRIQNDANWRVMTWAADEIERLRAIVDKLPKTADGRRRTCRAWDDSARPGLD